MIYAELFSSTRFSSGDRKVTWNKSLPVVSSAHGLAILRTCRRMHNEIREQDWLSRVLFHFENLEAMLDKLTNIPNTKLSQVRHVRVVIGYNDLIQVEHPPRWSQEIRLPISAAIKLLPGLKLDDLTLLGDTGNIYSYRNLNELLTQTNGWSKLYYISRSSGFLGYYSATVTSLPASQRLAHSIHQTDGRQGSITPIFPAIPAPRRTTDLVVKVTNLILYN